MNFAYTIIYVPDVPASLKFYVDAFGMTEKFMHESALYGELSTGTTTLAFAHEDMREMNGFDTQNNRLSEKPAGIEIAFVTQDVEKSYTHALAKGAVPIKKPIMKPWGQTVGYVRDLNGVLVEICSPMQ